MAIETWTCGICGQYNSLVDSNCKYCNSPRLLDSIGELPAEQAVKLSTLPPRKTPVVFPEPVQVRRLPNPLLWIGSAVAVGLTVFIAACWMLASVGGNRDADEAAGLSETPVQARSTLPPRNSRVPGTFTPYPTNTSFTSSPTETPPADLIQDIHIVEEGDTLSGIAAEYETSVDEIIEANGITDPNQIAVGTELIIPGKDIITTPTEIIDEAATELLPLEKVLSLLREVTGDSNASAELDSDGYLLLSYKIPENFEVFYMGTFRSELRRFMPRFAEISPELEYMEVEFAATGTVAGNPESMIAFVAYDKNTVESQPWTDLTNPQIIALAKRYNYNRNLTE